ncbi:hypothetical protein A5671_07855 [Mycolicibacter heraklionensis]|nr:hypothetical protein A5671_07855 [Mycolicibacter heraklionensis]
MITSDYSAEVGDCIVCAGDGTNTILIDTPMTAQSGDRIEVTNDPTYPAAAVTVSIFSLLGQTYGAASPASPSPGQTAVLTYFVDVDVPGLTVEPISGWYTTNYQNAV